MGDGGIGGGSVGGVTGDVVGEEGGGSSSTQAEEFLPPGISLVATITADDRCSLCGADLRGVALTQSHLAECTATAAQMQEAGELPRYAPGSQHPSGAQAWPTAELQSVEAPPPPPPAPEPVISQQMVPMMVPKQVVPKPHQGSQGGTDPSDD